MSGLKMKVQNVLSRLKENSCENLIWLISFLPNIGGFPLLRTKFNVMFWIIHTALSLYVYIVGVIVYQMYSADGFVDIIKGYLNIYVFFIICITNWWMLRKRNDLNELLKLLIRNDHLTVSSGRFLDKYQKLLRNIKIAIISWYIFQAFNDLMLFIPYRTLGMDNFATANCVGLEPLTSTPNRQICMAILTAQELFSIVVVVTYDVILIFLFAHTTSTFLILNEEMKNFQLIAMGFDGSIEMSSTISKYLKEVVIRHSLLLYTVTKMQNIYSASIGLSFGFGASFFCLFFVLPFEICKNFIPLSLHYLFTCFLYCFQGQRLTNSSEKFETAVYSCGWENLRIKEQRYVFLILKASQKPVIVYAAGVIPIHIPTFANTVQTVYKFVTIFKV